MAYTQFIYFFTLILSLFTIFFILLYFNMRNQTQKISFKTKGFKFLRRQFDIRQETYSPVIESFKGRQVMIDIIAQREKDLNVYSLNQKYKIIKREELILKRIKENLMCSKKEVFQYLATLVKFY